MLLLGPTSSAIWFTSSIAASVFHGNLSQMLGLSTKLQYEKLFREALIFLAGDWSHDENFREYVLPLCPKLRKIVENARNRIYAKVSRAQTLIIIFSITARRLLNLKEYSDVG